MEREFIDETFGQKGVSVPGALWQPRLRMNKVLFCGLMIGLVACSPKEQPPARPAAKSVPALHEYLVTFAAVKIPDEILKQLGLPEFEAPHLEENDRKLAAYVVAHPGDFSIAETSGNFAPVVWNGGETHIKFLLDAKKEAQDLDTLGLMTRRFDVRASVQDEDSQGMVLCDWFCSFLVHLKEPVGNSTDQGGSIPHMSRMSVTGQPFIAPLVHGKEVSLWMLGTIKRNTN